MPPSSWEEEPLLSEFAEKWQKWQTEDCRLIAFDPLEQLDA